jgi:hypothetical protein
MRHLGRIGLFVKTIKKFLTNLKRQHRSLFDQLDSELTKRYMSKKEESLFAMVKPADSGRTLDQVAEDVFTLTQRFASLSTVHAMSSFKLLTRLFKEQCMVEEEDDLSTTRAVAKPNKDVSSDSLQNPSDSDAGYSHHKGQGYQVQVVENYSESDKQLSLITHAEVETADQHDANALIPAIEDLKNRDMAPDEILADSLYGSDDNCEKAKEEYGVDVIAPVMPGNQKKIPLADFTMNNNGKITACPNSITPNKVKKTKQGFSASFPIATCQECKDFDRCPVTIGKKACYFRYKNKDIRLARRKQHEATSAFQEKYRYRAGVEATMSEYDRRTGVKHLRVRGLKAVKFAAIMKAIGLNIFRASRHIKGICPLLRPPCGAVSACLGSIRYIKEQIIRQIQFSAAFWLTIMLTSANRQKMKI